MYDFAVSESETVNSFVERERSYLAELKLGVSIIFMDVVMHIMLLVTRCQGRLHTRRLH